MNEARPPVSETATEARGPWSWRGAWMLSAIAPLGVLGLLFLVSSRVGEFHAMTWKLTPVAEFEDSLGEAARRITWGVTWAALMAVTLSAAAIAFVQVLGTVRRAPGGRRGRALTITLATLLAAVVSYVVHGQEGHFGQKLAHAVLPSMVRQDIELLLALSNTVAATTTVLVTAAVCSLCHEQARCHPGAQPLEAARSQMKLLLYAAAGILMLGAIEVRHLLSWAIPWTAANQQAGIQGLAISGSTAIGLIGSMLLVAIFLPAFAQLGTSSSTPAAEGESGDGKGPRKERILEGGKVLLALLAPVLGVWFDGWL